MPDGSVGRSSAALPRRQRRPQAPRRRVLNGGPASRH